MKTKKLQPCQERHFKYLNKKKQFSHLFKINFRSLNESKVKILTFTSQLHFTTNIFAFKVLYISRQTFSDLSTVLRSSEAMLGRLMVKFYSAIKEPLNKYTLL